MRWMQWFTGAAVLCSFMAGCGGTPPPQSTALSFASASGAAEDRVQALYVAYYGRPADPDGLAYWSERVAQNPDRQAEVVQAFGSSAEANILFGSKSNEDTVTALYLQILGRFPDEGGRRFYVKGLEDGRFTPVSIAANMLDGIPAGSQDDLQVRNRLELARLMTERLSANATEKAAYAGDAAAFAARAWLASVNSSASSTERAQNALPRVLSAMENPMGPVHPSYTLKNLQEAGRLDTKTYAPIKEGDFDLLAVGDLNADGHEDLLLGPKVYVREETTFEYVKLMVAFYRPESGNFELDAALQSRMPSMQWAHKAHIGDFNADGFADLVVVGTGPDQGQPCGEAPVLMLGSANGLQDRSEWLPRLSMYTHQFAVGDFNGDGKTDFFLLNNNWVPYQASDPRSQECSYRRWPGTNRSMLMLSNASGWEEKSFNLSTPDLGLIIGYQEDNSSHYQAAVAGDVNGDGKLDLVISGNGFGGSLRLRAAVLLGDGQGGFTFKSSLITAPFGVNTVLSAISSKDLDGDGIHELVISAARHPGAQAMPFQGNALRVFKADSTLENWVDVSVDYFPGTYNPMDTDLTFCDSITWIDLNQDGRDDMVCTIMAEFRWSDPSKVTPRVWVRADSGFERSAHVGFESAWRLGNLRPIRLKGQLGFVGTTNRSMGVLGVDLLNF